MPLRKSAAGGYYHTGADRRNSTPAAEKTDDYGKGTLMGRIALYWLLVVAVGLTGCSQMPMSLADQHGYLAYSQAGAGEATWAHSEQEADRDAGLAAALEPLAEETPRLSAVDPRRIVYTAEVRIATAQPEVAVARTRKLAEAFGGYMQKMTRDAIVIRVPAKSFDEALEQLAGMGTLVDQQVTAQDVTEEFVDLEIRLKNAKALLAKLHTLLDKATEVKQALAVEKEIARVQTDIETLEGKLNRLTSRIAYATLSVRFLPGQDIPPTLKLRLPFWWLSRLGVETMMSF
ncbi:MAG: DUF4349 domain-containing protein [Planctomycetota bacterium]|jgi:hypothetical protein